MRFDPHSSELINLNFHPLEVVSRYRDSQLQVTKNGLNLPNLCRNLLSQIRKIFNLEKLVIK